MSQCKHWRNRKTTAWLTVQDAEEEIPDKKANTCILSHKHRFPTWTQVFYLLGWRCHQSGGKAEPSWPSSPEHPSGSWSWCLLPKTNRLRNDIISMSSLTYNHQHLHINCSTVTQIYSAALHGSIVSHFTCKDNEQP